MSKQRKNTPNNKKVASLPPPQQDDCPICLEVLPKDGSKFTRFTCCGKGIHPWCCEGIFVSSMSFEQKSQCPLCRTKHPTSYDEALQSLCRWVEKGKAWAQCNLGEQYRLGEGGVQKSYPRAKELFELAIAQGNANAQFHLAQMYRDAQGVDQSYERAAEYYEAAAIQGDSRAQYDLGCLYCNGRGVVRSYETAREWMLKAAEQGNENAPGPLQQLETALDKIHGTTTPPFVPKPLECTNCFKPHTESKLRPCSRCHEAFYCSKKCQKKHWKQKDSHAHRHHCKKKKKKKEETKKKIEKKNNDKKQPDEQLNDCWTKGYDKKFQEFLYYNKKTGKCCRKLPVLHDNDCPSCLLPISKETGQVTRMICCGKGWHKTCFHQGVDSSHCPMCRAEYVNPGTPEDIKRLQKFVKKKIAWAQVMMGDRYREGNGVKQDWNQALVLYRASVEQGNSTAQCTMGSLYLNGQVEVAGQNEGGEDHHLSCPPNINKDMSRAMSLLKLSADQGNVVAMSNLGIAYWITCTEGGSSQINELINARTWFTKAAERGHLNAKKMLKIVNERYHLLIGCLCQTYEQLANEEGNVSAMLNLGIHYLKGFGVEQSIQKAKMWWTNAAEGSSSVHTVLANELLIMLQKDVDDGVSVVMMDMGKYDRRMEMEN